MIAELHRLVHTDVADALEFYEKQAGTDIAADFFVAFESCVEEIRRRPNSFASYKENLRRAEFARFPFHILFRVHPSDVFILAVRHNKRHPDFGLDR